MVKRKLSDASASTGGRPSQDFGLTRVPDVASAIQAPLTANLRLTCVLRNGILVLQNKNENTTSPATGISTPQQSGTNNVTTSVPQPAVVEAAIEIVLKPAVTAVEQITIKGKTSEFDALRATPDRVFSLVTNDPARGSLQITVRLTGQDILQAVQATRSLQATTAQATPTQQSNAVPPSVPNDPEKNAGPFGKLPFGVREKIFNFLHAVDAPIDLFYNEERTKLCAESLRCCKLFHTEGTSALYSANHFVIRRSRKIENEDAPQDEWKEVGFQHITQWLRVMGPTNVGKLRSIRLHFEDATRDGNAHLTTTEARRFINDPELPRIFAILASQATIAFLKLDFSGRARIFNNAKNATFLRRLVTVETDDLRVMQDESPQDWLRKHDKGVTALCKNQMVRRIRRYSNDFSKSRNHHDERFPPGFRSQFGNRG